MKKDTKKETKNKEVEELEGQLARALADYQNLERRVKEERSQWIKIANKELLLRMLPVLDTLILASQHTRDEGLDASIKQFIDVLRGEGVARIEVKGKKFDPKLMECVETGEENDNEVMTEIRPGFTIGQQVLRPAQVRVGKMIKEERYV